MILQEIIFIAFAAIACISALLVITLNNPVRCVLNLVGVFLATAVLWMLAYAEFLALILVLVYVGAVMTLFLFVVMMLNIDIVSMRRHFVRYLPLGLIIVALLVTALLLAIKQSYPYLTHLTKAVSYGADYSNTAVLGSVLYTTYAYALELAAVLLIVAIIAAISLAHRRPQHCKTQDVVSQIKVNPKDRVRLVKMSAEGSNEDNRT